MTRVVLAALLCAILLTLSGSVAAQSNVGINIVQPDNSAVLDLTSTNSGLLVPRMTMVQRNAIPAPATGLLIFQTDFTPEFYYYNSIAWVPFIGNSSGWLTAGNTGTVPGTNFLGTTDPNDFRLRTNNTDYVAFRTNGFMGLGQLAAARPLEVVVDNSTGYTASIRSATSDVGLLFGCASDASTYGSIQGYRRSGTSNVAANLAFQPASPGNVTGKVGISMISALPNVKWDILGDLALRKFDTTAVDTIGGVTNNDYNTEGHSWIRITGPTKEFKISGLSGGTDGRIVTLMNGTSTLTSHTGTPMIIQSNSANSSAANRIYTMSGADIVSTHNSTVSMIYSSTDSRWIVFSLSQ